MTARFRLVSNRPNAITGKHHVASASNPTVDMAAAVIAGLRAPVGIVSIIPKRFYQKAQRLLKNNALMLVDEKVGIDRRHQFGQMRQLAAAAIRVIIGPQYLKANVRSPYKSLLRRKRFVNWVRKEIGSPGSALNVALMNSKFSDLAELSRGYRWWYDLLAD
jgi:hypothetical protein